MQEKMKQNFYATVGNSINKKPYKKISSSKFLDAALFQIWFNLCCIVMMNNNK